VPYQVVQLTTLVLKLSIASKEYLEYS